MKRHKRLMGIVCAALLVGCAQQVGREINTDAVSKIVKGQTTRSEVVGWFGEPSSTTTGSDGKETLHWTYLKVKNNVSTYIPFAGANKQDINQQSLSIVVDSGKKVEDFKLSQGTPTLGGPQ